jgi:NADH:ubiquinone oxidoreductase subunit E
MRNANGRIIAEIWRLLAIAQEQRGAMAADEERTRAAAMRVWGEHVRGCDTADAMADLIVRQREEIARLRGDLAQADAALRSVP